MVARRIVMVECSRSALSSCGRDIVSLNELTSHYSATPGALGDGPCNFEPWPSDEEATLSDTSLPPFPDFHTISTREHLLLDIDSLCTVGLQRYWRH
ncbi:hypothetical protein TNCV_1530911 [Trichonephila clavipes]|nr:hypothetical protein TNCV_1530911 [Trichonephila clavipes]